MSEHIKSNQQLDEAINGAQSASELREAMLQTLAAQGQITRTRDDEFNLRLIRQQQTPDVSLPARGFQFEREFQYHPASGRRSLMLRANSLEELNELQAQMEKTV